MTTWLHERRLAAVADVVRASGARTVLDLGCGDGDLLVRLVTEPGIERIVGVDLCRDALGRLQERLAALKAGTTTRVDLVHGSMTEGGAALRGFDCAVLVETIEHTDPERLSILERSVFATMRPRCVVITTPNADCNPRLGVPPHRLRHPDHRFEWGHARFRRWSHGVAGRNGYAVAHADLAGDATQMAVFRRPDAATTASSVGRTDAA